MALQRWLVVSLACFHAAALTIPPSCNDSHVDLSRLDVSMDPMEALSILQQATMRNLYLEEQRSMPQRSTCSLENAAYREHLCPRERKGFIQAVQCLRSKPSIADPDFAKAARTRYDDFTAVHVNLTNFIHGTGSFLTWHRYFIWSFEKALRDECGYAGYLPYWNWFSHADDPRNSPVFDGSDTSIGGDDAYFPHNGSAAFFGYVPLPPANGGGCIASGPFKDIQATIGPIAAGMSGMEPPVASFHEYNPHCIRRDLSPHVSSRFFTTANLLNLTMGDASKTSKSFQDEFNGRPQDNGFMRLHSAGHYTINGENTDIYTSVNDPAFVLHHAMIDKVFWMWQVLHPAESRKVAGTLTLQNNPPLGNATIYDPLIMGVNADTRMIHELMGTMDGTSLCYIYA
ncbi:hypothetical protein B0I35DRAFT_453722 [Stachybotrys elegans]|uniref:Tyrosinase copper-binding domain-containing protein n=1 Tax=Stachybotrys elegans TaxID=80388 RepID=A0A8K0SFD5_9HYPO|nr:hypothetical protein B0I35DRAFT_453722 [Stachybotrys elegans]